MALERRHEADLYQRLSSLDMGPRAGLREELRTTPIFSLAVKDAVQSDNNCLGDHLTSSTEGDQTSLFNQYALLGFHAGTHPHIRENEPFLLNVDAPNSIFICGSQGSGKSYTLNCVLENCLLHDDQTGQVNLPIAGVAFQYDLDSAESVAETAHLCSRGIKVSVLVSQSNEHPLRAAYGKLPGAGKNLAVTPLLLHPNDLSIERMLKLMAFADSESSMPLYMEVARRILRKMATTSSGSGFDYPNFKRLIERENLTRDQIGPLNLRLDLLESFLDMSQTSDRVTKRSLFDLEPGTLTIVDLTDPFMDPSTVCVPFDISLSLIKEHRPPCGLIIALDEAHKYMVKSVAATNFTDRLLGTVREQRHNGTRVVVATQEPVVSEKLLDLCNTSIIHRFSSPAWFATIQTHLGGASRLVPSGSERQLMFDRIMNLEVGESLVFAPTAFICIPKNNGVGKLGMGAVNMKTRLRLGSDGGISVTVSANTSSIRKSEQPANANDSIRCSASTNAAYHSPKPIDFRACVMSLPKTCDVTTKDAGVDARANAAYPHRIVSAILLSNARSHLVLICCVCEVKLMLEFPKECFLSITHDHVEARNNGIAYATCIKCRRRIRKGTDLTLSDVDLGKMRSFQEGMVEMDSTLSRALERSLRPHLGEETAVLRHRGQLAYLTAKMIEQGLKGGSTMWMMQLSCSQGADPKIQLSVHRGGDFFKSTLPAA